MKYKEDLPPAIKDVSFISEGTEKLGITGRSGAGKSSIIACLFRLSPYIDGNILIDGIKIKKIGLSLLRKSLAYVP